MEERDKQRHYQQQLQDECRKMAEREERRKEADQDRGKTAETLVREQLQASEASREAVEREERIRSSHSAACNSGFATPLSKPLELGQTQLTEECKRLKQALASSIEERYMVCKLLEKKSQECGSLHSALEDIAREVGALREDKSRLEQSQAQAEELLRALWVTLKDTGECMERLQTAVADREQQAQKLQALLLSLSRDVDSRDVGKRLLAQQRINAHQSEFEDFIHGDHKGHVAELKARCVELESKMQVQSQLRVSHMMAADLEQAEQAKCKEDADVAERRCRLMEDKVEETEKRWAEQCVKDVSDAETHRDELEAALESRKLRVKWLEGKLAEAQGQMSSFCESNACWKDQLRAQRAKRDTALLGCVQNTRFELNRVWEAQQEGEKQILEAMEEVWVQVCAHVYNANELQDTAPPHPLIHTSTQVGEIERMMHRLQRKCWEGGDDRSQMLSHTLRQNLSHSVEICCDLADIHFCTD